MKLYLIIFLVFLAPLVMQSQTYEIGGFLGASNFIGDVGKTTFIAPKTPVFGALFKWNRSPRHSFRGSVLFTNIEGNDTKSKDDRRKERGYSFNNQLIELSVGLEYTFWEFSMYEEKAASTPYLYTGITYFTYSSLYFPVGKKTALSYANTGTFAIPMVIGYKTTLGNTKFVLAGEIGARYTFTDNLDGSNPEFEGSENYKFGNLNNNDWYMFTGVTLTYTFGRRPCYCNF